MEGTYGRNLAALDAMITSIMTGLFYEEITEVTWNLLVEAIYILSLSTQQRICRFYRELLLRNYDTGGTHGYVQ